MSTSIEKRAIDRRAPDAAGALLDAVSAVVYVARAELEEHGRVSDAAWEAVEDVYDALVACLPAPSLFARPAAPLRPLTDGNGPEAAPADVRPGERTT